MQAAIQKLVDLGPLPASAQASVATVQEIGLHITNIRTPVTDDEARALVRLLGPDGCFGLGRMLAELIETAPGWPLADVLESPEPAGHWIQRLRIRA